MDSGTSSIQWEKEKELESVREPVHDEDVYQLKELSLSA